MSELFVAVRGEPKTKGSLRPFSHRTTGRPMVREEMGERLRTWREQLSADIADAVGDADPNPEPVAVLISFRLPRPKKPRWPWPAARNRNDLDKLIRTVLDHLSGVVVQDDGQVVLVAAAKLYGEQPGAEILVVPISALSDPEHGPTLSLYLMRRLGGLVQEMAEPRERATPPPDLWASMIRGES